MNTGCRNRFNGQILRQQSCHESRSEPTRLSPPRRYFDALEDTVFMQAWGASLAGVFGRCAARIGAFQSRSKRTLEWPVMV